MAWIRQSPRLQRMMSFVYPYRHLILFNIGLTIIVALVSVLEPLVLKFIFDQIGENRNVVRFISGIVGLVILGVLLESLTGVSNWMIWKTRIHVQYDLLEQMVERLHRLPLDIHRKEGVGAIMTRLERGMQGFVSAASELAFHVVPAVMYLVAAIVIMLMLEWRLFLVIFIFVPLPIIFAFYAAPNQTQRERDLLNRWVKIYSRFNEVISGLVTVRSFVMEDKEKAQFLEQVDEANRIVIKGVGYDSVIGAVQNFMMTAARVATIGMGGYLVLNDKVTIGTIIAFLGYVSGLFGPIKGITGIYRNVKTAAVSTEQVFAILDVQEHIGDAPDAREMTDVAGEIAFENVHFSYGQREVLKGVSFQARPGQTVALVGPSGGGKSTITALLQRFYDPGAGVVKIDGHDIRGFKQKSVRRNIGVVLQDSLLFNESVEDNIKYGRPEATDEEVRQAATAANADEFISQLPEGYDTVVGERGSVLSMGERQRIAIARALLKDPPILILDEATSALDAEREYLIREAIERLITNRTALIIAHRLISVVKADCILVLKDGRIIESGRHADLMRRGGYYAMLVQKQTDGLI